MQRLFEAEPSPARQLAERPGRRSAHVNRSSRSPAKSGTMTWRFALERAQSG